MQQSVVGDIYSCLAHNARNCDMVGGLLSPQTASSWSLSKVAHVCQTIRAKSCPCSRGQQFILLDFVDVRNGPHLEHPNTYILHTRATTIERFGGVVRAGAPILHRRAVMSTRYAMCTLNSALTKRQGNRSDRHSPEEELALLEAYGGFQPRLPQRRVHSKRLQRCELGHGEAIHLDAHGQGTLTNEEQNHFAERPTNIPNTVVSNAC